MKIIPKLVNLLIVFLPLIICFSLADQDVIPFCNCTLTHLKTTVCETKRNFPYAPINFAISFLFMLLPAFIAMNIPILFKTHFTYDTFETILLIVVLVYNTVASGLYYGFSVEQGANLNDSSMVWLMSFLIAKTLSKIPHYDSGKTFAFWSFFLAFAALYDPYLFGFQFVVFEKFGHVVLMLLVVEFAYAIWIERRSVPIPYMLFALFAFVLASICFALDRNLLLCDHDSGLQWDCSGRSAFAIAVFVYFIGVRRQEKTKRLLVQNRFEEVSTRDDDDQLI